MAQGESLITEQMMRYPFMQSSRRYFDTISLDEVLASGEVLRQTESRLMSALAQAVYEPHVSRDIEFPSFFSAAFVASQDGFLTGKFSRREGERAKSFFVAESGTEKVSVTHQCLGLKMERVGSKEDRYAYSVGVEDYLALATRHELTRVQKWKLTRQPLWTGRVYFTENMLNDFFGDAVQRVISEGVKNLRRGVFPKQLAEIRARVLAFVPVPRTQPGRRYVYIDELMKHPISDGRHRFVWLVLAPYLVNVKKVDESEAIEKIKTYVSASGEMRAMKRFVEYNVRRAKRNGLMPPTMNKLRAEHPDLYRLLPKEVVVFEASREKRA